MLATLYDLATHGRESGDGYKAARQRYGHGYVRARDAHSGSLHP